MRFLLPLLLALIGAASGIGAGLYLKPLPEPAASEEGHAADPEMKTAAEAEHSSSGHEGAPAAETASADGHGGDETAATSEFIKLNNQFIVPVLRDGRISSMVVLSLSIETPVNQGELVYAQEPRLRDTFLQVLFDYANSGGFDGEFTNSNNMDLLRGELLSAGKKMLGDNIISLLITDIGRQDLG